MYFTNVLQISQVIFCKSFYGVKNIIIFLLTNKKTGVKINLLQIKIKEETHE